MKTILPFILDIINGIKTEKPERFKVIQKFSFWLFLIFLVVANSTEIFAELKIDYALPEQLIFISAKLYKGFALLFGFSYLPKKDINKDTND